MDLNQLRTFVTVAAEGHLTRAAERLYTSQPAVSAQLKALEESLDVVLFDRTPKGMRLTAKGEELLKMAQSTLDTAENMVSKARQMKGQIMGELRFGVNSDPGFLRVAKLLTACREQHPNITLSVLQSISPEILMDIRKGKLDSGFFFGPSTTADLHVIPLAEIPSAILAPRAWADRVRQATLQDLAQLPWIYATDDCPLVPIVKELLKGVADDVTKTVLVNNEEAIREFVRAEAGVALLRRDDAERAEIEGWGLRWRGDSPPIPLNVAVQARRLHEPLIQAWIGLLEEVWPESRQLQQAEQVG